LLVRTTINGVVAGETGESSAKSSAVEGRRDSLSVTGAVAGLLMRWLPCVGRSHRLVAPTPSSPIGRRVASSTLQLPAMPLSQRELFTVVRSWKSIQGEITHTGMRMFLR